MEEANSEVAPHAYCETEIASNEQTRENNADEVDDFTAENEQLAAEITQLAEQISQFGDEIAETRGAAGGGYEDPGRGDGDERRDCGRCEGGTDSRFQGDAGL